MLALLLAAIAATAPTPAPQPTPQLKVIVNIKSSSLCSSMHAEVLPVAFVTHRNDEAFAALNHSMLKFLEQIPGVTSSSIVDMNSMDTSLDNAELYSPNAQLSVEQMNRIAYQIAQNLKIEDHMMNESWKEYPKGKFANVDAFRQRMQNMIDLQRALEEKYFQFTQMYFGNSGQSQYAPNPSLFEAFLHNTIAGYGSALAVERTQSDPEVLAKADAHNTARYGNVAQVVKQLRLQEVAFSQEMTTAAQTCGIVPAPRPAPRTPSPTPSPKRP